MNTLFDLTSPAVGHYLVTPNDTAVLNPRPRSLRVLTDGDLEIQFSDSGESIVYPVSAGEILPVRPIRVKLGTTATVAAWY